MHAFVSDEWVKSDRIYGVKPVVSMRTFLSPDPNRIYTHLHARLDETDTYDFGSGYGYG